MKKPTDKNILKIMIMMASLVFSLQGRADISATCHGQSMLTTMSSIYNHLDYFFPITMGDNNISGSNKLPDTPNPSRAVCECGSFPDEHIGVAMGYWEPMALVDVTRTPYCMVNLGGVQIGNNPNVEGEVDTQTPEQNSGFYYVHYYNFPVIQWIFSNLLGGSCITDGDFNIPYFSELDPLWHNETLSNVIFPDAAIATAAVGSNPIAVDLSCGAEEVKIDSGFLPMDDVFWCAGSQGFVYPLTGEVAEDNGVAQASTLIAERTVFMLHHLAWMKDTRPDDLCEEYHRYTTPKSRYRYEMIYPVDGPQAPFGKSTTLWGLKENVLTPTNGDDAAFLIWRKRNCCSW